MSRRSECPSGKAAHSTDEQAQNAMWAQIRRPRPGKRAPVRTYRCPDCKRWHTTSICLSDWEALNAPGTAHQQAV